MMLKKSMLFVVAMVGAASVGVVAAQHFQGSHATTTTDPAIQFLHHACTATTGGATRQPHVPDDLAKALELTAAQQAEIDRIATDACAQLTRIHESMLNVLTPEQRAKVNAMHGGEHGADGMHEIMKKLHGGN